MFSSPTSRALWPPKSNVNLIQPPAQVISYENTKENMKRSQEDCNQQNPDGKSPKKMGSFSQHRTREGHLAKEGCAWRSLLRGRVLYDSPCAFTTGFPVVRASQQMFVFFES